MGSGPSCIENIWKNTPFDNTFTGYRSKNYIDGTLPECLFRISSLNQLYAGGNRVLGEFPSSGISSVLRRISLPYNSMHGTLPSNLGENNNITLFI